MEIWTIGHWNYSKEDFLRLLDAQGIDTIADVRSLPGSRRSPHFNKEQMSAWMFDAGRHYIHLPELGGRRRAQHVDPQLNAGWENASFRNYADYTTTREYETGLQTLLSLARLHRVAYMCGEPMPWRCHRSLISNTLAARGVTVRHIVGAKTLQHELGKWGAKPTIVGSRVSYPGVVVQVPLFDVEMVGS